MDAPLRIIEDVGGCIEILVVVCVKLVEWVYGFELLNDFGMTEWFNMDDVAKNKD